MINNKYINLVFSCDENYIKLLVPCIISVMDNKNADTSIDIFILETEISDYHKNKIKELETFNNITNVKIEFINIIDKAEQLIVKTDYHLSNASLYRLLIPQIFTNKERLLYLDVDIIVQKDLLEIYNQSFEDNYIIASKLGFPSKEHDRTLFLNDKEYDTPEVYKNLLNIPSNIFNSANYLNSGVTLYNNAKIIADGKDKELIDNYFQYKDFIIYADQDILVKTFLDKVKPLCWSKHVVDFNIDLIKNKNISISSALNTLDNATLIHYIYIKPHKLNKAFKTLAINKYLKYLQVSYLRIPNWKLKLAKLNAIRKYSYKKKMWFAIPQILFSSYID